MAGSATNWLVIAEVLRQSGCSFVTGVPADEPGLLDAALSLDEMAVLTARDQRAAVAAATGFSLVSNTPTAVALTSGPAFSNALPSLFEAASLCVPLIVVTTRPAAEMLGRGAFQELPQEAIGRSFAKWYHRVERPRTSRGRLRTLFGRLYAVGPASPSWK